MEGTFNSAKSQLKANYVQHFLTGEDKYKATYEAAQATMDSILMKAPDQEEPESIKKTHERSVVMLNQTGKVTSIPGQSWKYWTIGLLLLGTFGLSMF
jgi:hypothetical protein